MKARKRITPEVNLTPLIDIVFLLLVFFMLTAHFVKEQSITLELPESQTAQESQEKITEISILKTGEIFFENEKISQNLLKKKLSTSLAEKKSKEIFIRGDKEIPLKLLVEIMDISKLSGAKSVSIETTK